MAEYHHPLPIPHPKDHALQTKNTHAKKKKHKKKLDPTIHTFEEKIISVKNQVTIMTEMGNVKLISYKFETNPVFISQTL